LLGAAGPLAGKRVLDFGCGPGQTSRVYAQEGVARVDDFDISGEDTRIAAKRDGLVFFRHQAAEEIDYQDACFDIVIGKAILHHTDLEKAAFQLHRVLRHGGAAYFLEPLAYNPSLNCFRRLKPWRRMPTERPLNVEDLEIFRRYLSVTYRGFYLFTLLAHFLIVCDWIKKFVHEEPCGFAALGDAGVGSFSARTEILLVGTDDFP
jgi:SAM-dependent methyltransferase